MKNKDKTKEELLEELAEKKLSEESLRESEKRYRTLFEKNPYGIQEVDAVGTIIYANKAHHEIYGYEEGALIGRSITDFLVPGKQRDELPRYLQTLVKDQPMPTLYHQKILTKSGKERDIEVAWNYQIDNKGNVIGFLSVLTDITERKKAEIALTDSMDRFRGLVETTSDWIWEVNEKAVYTYASPKIFDILGYIPEEVIGKTPFDLMPPNEAKRVADIFSPIATSQKPFKELENTNLHKDGHLVVLETSGVPIININGKFCGYRGIDRDITDRKKAENKLKMRASELRESNIALKVLLKQRENDRGELEENILSNVKHLIMPYIEKLKKNRSMSDELFYLNILESNLKEIISPFAFKLSSNYLDLTPKEIQLAGLIKDGKQDKEITELLNISINTVQFHRKNIRKKLGIYGKRKNLRAHLLLTIK
jgi:PAS domain S-box-containing protein